MTSGPYIAFALVCEKVLQEQDGVLSAIRIVDRLNLNKIETEKLPTQGRQAGMPSGIAGVNFLIGLKSGDYKGKGKLELRAYSPSGDRMEKLRVETEVELRGDYQGANVIMDVGIPFIEEGVYWIDIVFNDRVLTRMPLSVYVNQNSTPDHEPKPADRPPSQQAH